MANQKKIISPEDQYLYMAIFNYDLLRSSKLNNILDDSKYLNTSILGNKDNLEIFKEVGVDNQMSLLSSLYSLFVLPKENDIFKRDKLLVEINEFLNKNVDIIGENTYNDNDLAKHMRNAISHSKVKFLPNSIIQFNDELCNKKTPQKKSITFQISLKNISIFLEFLIRKSSEYLNNKYLNK